jgi:2-haloacid dehalogenase
MSSNPKPPKNIVFDVVGTLVSFNAYHTIISSAIGPLLLSHNQTAQSFGYTWMTAAELEFTFLSISSRYTPYKEVLRAIFYRTLWMLGVEHPREKVTEEEREKCIQGYSELELRDGVGECFEKLRGAGFTVWCFTTGDIQRVLGYFERGTIQMPKQNFVSCDTVGVAKPALEAYRQVLEKLGEAEEGQRWFAAAHMWDVSAATMVGFRGAYCSVYERDNCAEIFGERMDVIADSLPEMAEKIILASV